VTPPRDRTPRGPHDRPWLKPTIPLVGAHRHKLVAVLEVGQAAFEDDCVFHDGKRYSPCGYRMILRPGKGGVQDALAEARLWLDDAPVMRDISTQWGRRETCLAYCFILVVTPAASESEFGRIDVYQRSNGW
jgi:hypothetical protein